MGEMKVDFEKLGLLVFCIGCVVEVNCKFGEFLKVDKGEFFICIM